MRHHAVFSFAATLLSGAIATDAVAQPVVTTRDVRPADAVSPHVYGLVIGIRPLRDGSLLVNDGGNRQLLVLDDRLTRRSIVLDSVEGTPQSYGSTASTLMPYRGDSSLFVDRAARALLLLDGRGAVARVIAHPKPADLPFLVSGRPGVDGDGNLVYRAAPPPTPVDPSVPLAQLRATLERPDSSPVVRARFDTRTVDTLAWVSTGRSPIVRLDETSTPRRLTVHTIPVASVDDWTMLADGRVAIVRGGDYHVDFIEPSGRRSVGPRLAFDWRRLGDSEKQQLVDSARAVQRQQPTNASVRVGGEGGTRMRVRGAALSTASDAGTVHFDVAPPSALPDFWPPVRAGTTMADRDGNLWILPTTSAQASADALVYDVVNSAGTLSFRVRMPAGRSIVGFAPGGVVFMTWKTYDGWRLERARLAP